MKNNRVGAAKHDFSAVGPSGYHQHWRLALCSPVSFFLAHSTLPSNMSKLLHSNRLNRSHDQHCATNSGRRFTGCFVPDVTCYGSVSSRRTFNIVLCFWRVETLWWPLVDVGRAFPPHWRTVLSTTQTALWVASRPTGSEISVLQFRARWSQVGWVALISNEAKQTDTNMHCAICHQTRCLAIFLSTSRWQHLSAASEMDQEPESGKMSCSSYCDAPKQLRLRSAHSASMARGTRQRISGGSRVGLDLEEEESGCWFYFPSVDKPFTVLGRMRASFIDSFVFWTNVNRRFF